MKALPRYEIVANASEGRDASVLEALARAITETENVLLLDLHADVDHDRSVLTYASDDTDALIRATIRLSATATARIDLSATSKTGSNEGVHPRIGALDVVPVVPIGLGANSAEASAIAIEIARMIGATGVPVHRYGLIARDPSRAALTPLRRGGFRGLRALHEREDGAPDDGPALPHATAGATAVGVRAVMAAWNIELAEGSEDRQRTAAQKIASAIRGSASGGVTGLQALGFFLRSRGRAQVSMNLHDAAAAAARGDTLAAIRMRIAALAVQHGTSIGATEIVGLLPEAVLCAGGNPEELEISGGWERASLERRVAAAR